MLSSSVSIVIPVDGKIDLTEKIVSQCINVFSKRELLFEIIVVNYSKSKSICNASLLQRYSSQVKFIDIIGGYSEALLAGFKQARYPEIFHIDYDHKLNPNEFFTLLKYKSGNSISSGITINSGEKLHLFINKILSFLIRILFKKKMIEANSPIKIIDKRLIDLLLPVLEKMNFIPSIALAVIANKYGFGLAETPVVGYSRISSPIFTKKPFYFIYVYLKSFVFIVKLFFYKQYIIDTLERSFAGEKGNIKQGN